MSSSTEPTEYYSYQPDGALPAVFAITIGASLVLHIWQNM